MAASTDRQPTAGGKVVNVCPWVTTEAGRLIARGHPTGDFLEAWKWDLLEEGEGRVRVLAHLPDHVRDTKGEMFGSFAPTYVDLIALFTVRSRYELATSAEQPGLATSSIRLGYLDPIVGPTFILDARCEKRLGRTHIVLTRFIQNGCLAALASTTIRETKTSRSPMDR